MLPTFYQYYLHRYCIHITVSMYFTEGNRCFSNKPYSVGLSDLNDHLQLLCLY